MRSGSRAGVLSVVLSLSFSLLISAQTATTSLRGTVTDPKGAIVQGATVLLNNASTGFSRTTKSGTDGVYQFLEVPPATYTLTVTAPGFATLKQDRVTLQVSQPATLDIAMQVRGATEVVEVSGEAALVNTTDASQGNVFNSTQLINLPSEGRDPVAILSLQPGVTYVGQNVDQSQDSRGGSVAGARSDQTNVTLDGLDNNDQLTGLAFQGALKAPLDSLQEFRVTTSNSNADAGRSSGAQVSMVTKSGTNNWHGSLYEYNRSNIGQANDWFNKHAELQSNLPNKPGPLVRNTFGASFGGPIKKDRLFFFADYEGQRTNEAVQTTRIVPSDLMRTGVIQYPCDSTDPACVPGFVDPAGNYSINSNGVVALTPQGLASTDTNCQSAPNNPCPWGGGADPFALAIFQQYPSPNSDALGDGFDYRAFTFAAPAPAKLDTYILKLDYKLTASGNHSLFVKGHLQNFHNKTAPQFPGLPANDFITNNSKGLFVGYTALFRPTLVNNLRYGFIRAGLGDSGLSATDYNVFRGLDNVQGLTNTILTNVPVHNLVDDLSWTKGKHTFQFGGNLRIITNNRNGNAQNISTADTNVFWLDNAGIANTGSSLDPGAFGYPAVSGSFGESYDFATAAIAGLLTETNKTYNQDKTGHFFAPGEMIQRNFRSTEGEMYAQDSWRVTPNLVLTGGLRYSLLQPPYERNGNQVAPSISLNSWFKERGQAMLAGNTINSTTPGGLVQMSLGGQANGKAPYWAWDYKNLAPRLAFAYSPHANEGFLHKIFGGAGKTSIRGGYGIYFDHFGEGIVNSFDKNGSFGLTTQLVNPAGSQDVDCTPRLTSLFTLPPANTSYCGQQVVGPQPPPLPGLITPPTGTEAGSFAIYWGLDDKLKTPYSHVVDFSITRDLGRNLAFEASYVGRFAHHLLQEEDLAMPLDLVDPSSKMDYFTAATMLTKATNSGTDISQVAPIPFWENLFPGAAGSFGFGPGAAGLGCAPGNSSFGGTTTATQAMYDMYSCFAGNETTALFIADLLCLPACAQLPGQTSAQPFAFFDDQFSSLYAWRSIGNSAYNGLQLTLRKAMSSGLQFDFNYTYSKSMDIGSNAERINEFEGFGFASQVINSWSPGQLRSVSDFDTTHQINSNWVYELPFGRGRHFGSGMGKAANAIVGGWGLSGIFHWTSGLPWTMGSGAGWSTNWQLQGQAIKTGSTGKMGVFTDANGNPNIFQNTTQAISAFRFPYPGESGQRNNLRGPGYFELDDGLWKTWDVTETKHLKFSWEVFNVTNAVRFDAALSAFQYNLTFGNFGAYSNTLSKPRVMQFSLRFDF
ncbi:MAG TPA: carboxypeptidase-like regulatory domain-containing protein [Candidatus Sulfotelmatobacter sp.]|nr:carboxypeptidase-like regulatory domain-containing protein [Candidatus Sulfotelmatobacter sp.]